MTFLNHKQSIGVDKTEKIRKSTHGCARLRSTENEIKMAKLIPFLPTYESGLMVNEGSKGPVVRLLVQVLQSLGFGVDGLENDGEYGPKVASSVRLLQQWLNVDMDGQFGHNTIDTLAKTKEGGLSLRLITWHASMGRTWCVSANGTKGWWPPM